MELRVVWRNPEPLIKTKQKIYRIRREQGLAVYWVADRVQIQKFLLMSHQVA